MDNPETQTTLGIGPMLSVSLDCSFFIASLVSSNVYSVMVDQCPMLSVSLDCPFFIASLVSSNVYSVMVDQCPMLSVSLDCPFLTNEAIKNEQSRDTDNIGH
jgi:Zn-finger nucleic acid-binding protein